MFMVRWESARTNSWRRRYRMRAANEKHLARINASLEIIPK